MRTVLTFLGANVALRDSNTAVLRDSNSAVLRAARFSEKYDDSSIISVQIGQIRSPISLDLQSGSFVAKIAATDDAQLTEATRLKLTRGAEVVGSYNSITGSNSLKGIANVSGSDAVALLDSVNFLGRFLTATTATSIISEICDMAQVKVAYSFSELPDESGTSVSLENVLLNGYLHGGSGREALQKICFATGFMPIVQGDGSLKMYYYGQQTATQLFNNVSYNLQVSKYPYYSAYQVVYVKYALDRNADAETVISETLDSGLYDYQFDGPHAQYAATGCTIIESGSNYVKFSVASDGTDIEIKGKPYKGVKIVESFDNPVKTGATNVYRIEGIEISSNIGGIMQRLYKYFSGSGGTQSGISASVLVSGIDALTDKNMLLTLSSNYDTINADIEQLDYSLTANDNIFVNVKGTRRYA